MNTTIEGGRLWPLVATLGAVATTNGAQTTVQGVLGQLGALCGADAELWEPDGDPARAEAHWRVRTGRATQSLALQIPAERQPDAQVAHAAATLRTVVADGPDAALAIPMCAFGRAQGVLRLRATRAGADLSGWRRELEQFAAVLGLYLHAAELNEALASGALRDRLNGIANQAQLHDHLERELARARRARRPFALLMLAPDRFDSLGRDLGLPLRDHVARSLATLLREACRDGDIVGRYGAERFVLLLPDSDGQGAQAAARRFLAQCYRRPIALPEGNSLYVDLSIGIALFPVDGATIGELVEGAALALREAQRLGGNRAVAA